MQTKAKKVKDDQGCQKWNFLMQYSFDAEEPSVEIVRERRRPTEMSEQIGEKTAKAWQEQMCRVYEKKVNRNQKDRKIHKNGKEAATTAARMNL